MIIVVLETWGRLHEADGHWQLEMKPIPCLAGCLQDATFSMALTKSHTTSCQVVGHRL